MYSICNCCLLPCQGGWIVNYHLQSLYGIDCCLTRHWGNCGPVPYEPPLFRLPQTKSGCLLSPIPASCFCCGRFSSHLSISVWLSSVFYNKPPPLEASSISIWVWSPISTAESLQMLCGGVSAGSRQVQWAYHWWCCVAVAMTDQRCDLRKAVLLQKRQRHIRDASRRFDLT